MAACGIAFFQRGLDDAAQFVELIDELESSSSFTHAVLTEAYTEAMTAVAAAAAATQRVELVTGIVNIYWRHPYALAMAAANVAAVSGGRGCVTTSWCYGRCYQETWNRTASLT
jgi:alkanesulfonate monooxygenase SsuD/methylene tetrahydromethanopterin reductase-like flavin-dependent oxidoreductase (luciferase family)